MEYNLFPKVIKIKQKFKSYKLKESINLTIAQGISEKNIKNKIKPGMSIAVGVGKGVIEENKRAM